MFKLYMFGFFLTALMVIARLFYTVASYDNSDIFWMLLKTFGYAHLLVIIGFSLMKIQRIMYKEFFVGFRITLVWIGIMFISMFLFVGFMTEIDNALLDTSLVHAIWMLPIGAVIENMLVTRQKEKMKQAINKLPKDEYENQLLYGKHSK